MQANSITEIQNKVLRDKIINTILDFSDHTPWYLLMGEDERVMEELSVMVELAKIGDYDYN